MLKNIPPQGTHVRFLRQTQMAPRNAVATLVRPLDQYQVDGPDDRFEVEFEGWRLIVRRADIMDAERRGRLR